MAPPAASEQIDRGDQERKQGCDQHELDGPASNHAGAEIDVTRRPSDELGTLIERAQKLLSATPDLCESAAVQVVGRVGEWGRSPVARSGHGQRADTV